MSSSLQVHTKSLSENFASTFSINLRQFWTFNLIRSSSQFSTPNSVPSAAKICPSSRWSRNDWHARKSLILFIWKLNMPENRCSLLTQSTIDPKSPSHSRCALNMQFNIAIERWKSPATGSIWLRRPSVEEPCWHSIADLKSADILRNDYHSFKTVYRSPLLKIFIPAILSAGKPNVFMISRRSSHICAKSPSFRA